MPPKQKPNEACACGSGAKHKKCCFGKAEQAPASAGVPRPPVQSAEQAMCRKMAGLAGQVAILSRDALDADAAGDFRKAYRKIEAALPFVAVVATSAASSHNTIRAMLSNFTFAIEYASRNGDLAGAENAAERALALLTPPYGAPLGVYPAALGTLSHAGWRDTPADPKEVRVQINAAALAAVARDMMLSTVLGELGCARSRAYRGPEAVQAYEDSLAAIALEDVSAERCLRESACCSNIGNQYLRQRQTDRAREFYVRAQKLLDQAEGADGVRAARQNLALNMSLLRDGQEQEQGPDDVYSRRQEGSKLSRLEALWQSEGFEHMGAQSKHELGDLHETASGVCRNALMQCATVTQQRPWLRRFLATRLARTGRAAAASATLTGGVISHAACRACAKSAADAAAIEGGKLRLCTACKGVAYCSTACQKADWPRHKLPCKAAAAAAATGTVDHAAALADAMCPACHLSLVPDDAAGDCTTPGKGLVTVLRCDHAVHAACLDALRAKTGTEVPVLCPACGVPFQSPLSPLVAEPDGVRIMNPAELAGMAGRTTRSVDEMAASFAASGMPAGFPTSAPDIAAQLRAMGILGMSV